MLGLTGDGRAHVRAAARGRASRRTRAARLPPRRVRPRDGRLVASAAGGQQSSQLRPMADANALLVVPEGADAAEPGVPYEAILLEPLSLLDR